MGAGSGIFCYDANGNMTQKIDGSSTNYTYDAENHMTADSQARVRGYDVEYRLGTAGSWTALLSGTARTQTGFAPCVKTTLRVQSGQWL